ncbi:hypothetical protein FOA52_004895 [Chlamydomonas sp. UWO 241]|nr:hypothetical protein FOA52_004895 [Chlamydomonas sp. UWO 241]
MADVAKDGISLPVCLATDLVRLVHAISKRAQSAGGGVLSASLLNAKPAVRGIGVEPRVGGVLRVLFTVASDAVADTVVRWCHALRRCVDPSAAVFDVLSDREVARHQALWPAFVAAKAAGKRALFHRARLVFDGEQAVADAASALVVTPAEVRAAATHSKPGTAPGPDGIPVDVWRKLGEPAFELLAAVFTAVGATGGTPPGFLDGVVASIYKAKNAADAANYRPLTMLGSDYRILAKVLATLWTPLLSAVVGPEQTAFLAGRRISDNICLTQMLPGLLAANAAEGVGPTGAALALLDFRKAYNTIDRGFLIAVMEAVGVGDGLLAWTRTILTHTYASAEANGFISAPRKYAAGVRQGCPAAPALFLFLGHALACFLRTCPAVGVEVVPGCRVTCPQYADDCMPLLRSCAPADVAALGETMAVFGRATGLVLNLGKCGILPLGSAGEGLLAVAEVAGLRVLDAGVSLGVPVSAGLPPPEGVTGVCRERLAAAYTKLARFPMSAFGRGHAAATYGVSRILFRAVHCGMTSEAERVLSRWTATLVDRSVGPTPPAELPRWASSVPDAIRALSAAVDDLRGLCRMRPTVRPARRLLPRLLSLPGLLLLPPLWRRRRARRRRSGLLRRAPREPHLRAALAVGGGLPARVGDASLRLSFVASISVEDTIVFVTGGDGCGYANDVFSGCFADNAEEARRRAAEAAAGVSMPVRLATNIVRFMHDNTGNWDGPAGGGVVAASFINAKPAVGGIDTVVRWRWKLRQTQVAVFDILSDREEARHRALWPAFLAAKAAGKRAQFHRARLVVDGERVAAPVC